jgi:hypothetical protein
MITWVLANRFMCCNQGKKKLLIFMENDRMNMTSVKYQRYNIAMPPYKVCIRFKILSLGRTFIVYMHLTFKSVNKIKNKKGKTREGQ